MNDLPSLSHRRALLTLETHQAFHLGFAEEMRRRMRALLDAYFDTTGAALAQLRDAFGVTHLLVDTTHFGSTPPPYFAPFDEWTRMAHAKARAEGVDGLFHEVRRGGGVGDVGLEGDGLAAVRGDGGDDLAGGRIGGLVVDGDAGAVAGEFEADGAADAS